MKKFALSAVLAVAAGAGVAHAGYKYSSVVYVSSNNIAGQLGAARNGPDNASYLYVGVSHSATHFTATLGARDPYGTVKTCFTSDPGLIQTLATAPSDAYISASFDPVTAACTYVSVTNGSHFQPKVL